MATAVVYGTGSTVKTRDYKDATDLICVNAREDPIHTSGKDLPLGALSRGHAVMFTPANLTRGTGSQPNTTTALTLLANGKQGEGFPCIATPMQVRRLTPRECERLQGMPDDHTRIPWRNKPAEECPDTPRYKAIGNSMAVPVMRWIGERIQIVDTIYNE